MYNKILGLALAATFSVGTANAASITESFSVGLQTTALTSVSGATGNVAIGNFNQFNNALGTLTSVDIDITGFSQSSTVLTNTAANTQTFRFSSALDWLFEVLDGDDVLDFAFNQNLFNTGFISMLSGEVLDLGTVNPSDVYSISVSGADLAAFVGAGSVGIGCNTFSSTTFTGSSNISAAQSTSAGCSADITYNYDASVVSVPEPAGIALLGLGLAMMGFAGKRKKA